MVRLLAMMLISTIVSGYYFSFSFKFLPSVNTKMMLAGIGLALAIYQACHKHQVTFSKELMGAAGFAFVFSFICFIAADYNNTDDYSYATYFLSFFTWLAGGYTVCAVIRVFYKKITLRLLVNYLAFVCALQCALAILIDRIPAFQLFVNTFFLGGEFYQSAGRLYGIGAALDPAGIRFAIVLLLITYILLEDESLRKDRKGMIAFIICFFLISVLGNMISRTTIVGTVMGFIYIIYSTGIYRLVIPVRNIRFYFILTVLLILFVTIAVYFYYTDTSFHANIRFAFEGFFNWAEEGEWRTNSTDTLNNLMWIWPEDLKTWIIGSGKFGLFAYGTDIGYCRFILYCGLIGFSTFGLFFVYNAFVFADRFPSFRLISIGILVLSFIIWMKVATDIFLIYALFYSLDWEENSIISSK